MHSTITKPFYFDADHRNPTPNELESSGKNLITKSSTDSGFRASKMLKSNKTFVDMDIKKEFMLFLRHRMFTSSADRSITTVKNNLSNPTLNKTAKYAQKKDGSGFFDNETVSVYNKYNMNNIPDEWANIWKLAFFLLIFFIGIVSLVVILTILLKLVL